MKYDVVFPNLFKGIYIEKLNPIAFEIFGQKIYWYGIIIVAGILLGLLLTLKRAKKSGQNPDDYNDFLLYALIFSVIGARLYYVIFSWENYKDNLWQVFHFRGGGLAIYGAVIGAIVTLLIYSRLKNKSFYLMADTMVPSLILGQAIGRWGNFMNMEAFGGPSQGFLAMALNVDKVKYIPGRATDLFVNLAGQRYIQVQPTFLYESLWNFGVLVVLLIWDKHFKRFEGELLWLYLLGYGLGRTWIEGLRTDQLIIGQTGVPVSQLLAAILVVVSAVVIVYRRRRVSK